MQNFLIIISFFLIVIAICRIFQIRFSDFEKLIDKRLNKEKTIKQMTSKKESFILKNIKKFNAMLKATGQSEKITTTIIISLLLGAVGAVVGIVLSNAFLVPVFAFAFGMIPFIRIQNLYAEYKTQMLAELSSALPIINTSFMRSKDIEQAISENIDIIEKPLKEHLEEFLTTVRYINPSVKDALETLKMRVDNSTFVKWCETMQTCVDDKSQMAALPAIGEELTRINHVIGNIKNILFTAKKNFFTMVGMAFVLLLVCLYVLPSSFMIPTDTPLFKFLLAINLLVMLITLIRSLVLTRQTNFDM